VKAAAGYAKKRVDTGCESKLSHRFPLSFSIRFADAMAAPSACRVVVRLRPRGDRRFAAAKRAGFTIAPL